jgi:hypothetical protein
VWSAEAFLPRRHLAGRSMQPMPMICSPDVLRHLNNSPSMGVSVDTKCRSFNQRHGYSQSAPVPHKVAECVIGKMVEHKTSRLLRLKNASSRRTT